MVVLLLQVALPFALGITGIWVGFALNPVLILAATLVFVRVRYGKKAVPLIVEADEDRTVMAEFEFSDEAAGPVADALVSQLEARGVHRDERERGAREHRRSVSLPHEG